MKRLRRRALIVGATMMLVIVPQSSASAGVGEFVDDVLGDVGDLTVEDPGDPQLLCIEVGVEEKTPICLGCYQLPLGIETCEPECTPESYGPIVIQCI